ncbi:MAG TPA: RDD family protein [Candidatus Angelobacter sp.]|nr:RDD family protein [Candidatus Angelobacter sp.]
MRSRLRRHRARRCKSGSGNSLDLDFDNDSPVFEAETVGTPILVAPREDSPKVIEFPRSTTSWAADRREYGLQEELEQAGSDLRIGEDAGISEGPRILDAPDPKEPKERENQRKAPTLPAQQLNLLPTFADIRLDADESKADRSVELPPQPASLQQRAFAILVDIALVLAAAVAFAAIFFLMSNGMFSNSTSTAAGSASAEAFKLRLILLGAAAVCCLLWLIYQYLFLVYASVTPGMKLAGLEVCTFQGDPAPVSARRWRAFACLLSGISVGLGFAWAFVDEDTLSWHDRITQTHVRSIE